MVNLTLQIVFFFCGVSVSKAFLHNRRVDCLVTSWSEWGDPNEDRQRIRSCSILRLPSGGGKPCPHIKEVKDEGCNCTSWSDWSGSFGFEQTSRTREWLEGPRKSLNNSVAKRSLFKCSNAIEEDIRYTGIVPGLSKTTLLFTQLVILSTTSQYQIVNKSQIGIVRDIVLILDSSGSIGKTNFTQAKEDARTLFNLLCPEGRPFDKRIPYQYQQLAMITFSTTVDEDFFFNSYNSTKNVLNAISNARYHGQNTNTAEAFRKANDMFQTNRGARNIPDEVKNEVLILTDGHSNTGGDAVAAAKALSEVADVYALTIGKFSASGMEELTSYVSKPASQHLFNVADFSSLRKLVEAVVAEKEKRPHWCAPLDTK